MKSFVYHIQLNVNSSKVSFPFYEDFLTYLGYKTVFKNDSVLGMGNNHNADIWLIETQESYKKNRYHRKNTGLNHIAFGVNYKEDVDNFANDFLLPRNIKPIYDSPKEYPEYEKGYYAVFFEDPDRVKLEVTYKPGFFEKTSKQ